MGGLNGTIGVRLILNGFPKSGLHLSEMMARCLLNPYLQSNWIGVIDQGAWGTGWRDIERTLGILRWQSMGTYLKGHLGYRQELVDMMAAQEIGMVFIYRDPRDVLCSILRHIKQMNGQHFIHPGRDEVLALPDDEARLLALLEGWKNYGGLFERWEMYSPWLWQDNVLPLPYEYMRHYPRKAAELFILYTLGRAALPSKLLPMFNRGDLDTHIETTCQYMATGKSLTFLKGSLGGWKEEFTPEIKTRFKVLAGDWLQTLGYESDKDW